MIHPTAVIEPGAQLGENVTVGAFAYIGAHVILGDHCVVQHHATIDGHFLRITKQNANIPSAQVSVVNASNGGLVLNQLMTDSMEETISDNGVYVLHIETDGGALVGQFMVQ